MLDQKPPPTRSRAPAIIATAVITFIATSALWATGLVFVYVALIHDPPKFAVTVDVPAEAAVGEALKLEVNVSNPTDERLELGSLDVYDSLLNGFDVVQVEPVPERREHTLLFSSYYYSHALEPGASFRVTFQLKAVKLGVWSGDVDACTPGEKFVTSAVTIAVR